MKHEVFGEALEVALDRLHQDSGFDVSAAQLQAASKENARHYDGLASGSTFYNYFRDYDPAIGRYTQSDPVGLVAGMNTYSYVQSDPLTATDRYGLAEDVHPPGGPYHPPPGVHLRCTIADSCPQLETKMFVIRRMIRSHEAWDAHNPPPRGGGRHAQEIADLRRAYANCEDIYRKKNCDQCPPRTFKDWFQDTFGSKPKPVDPIDLLDPPRKKPTPPPIALPVPRPRPAPIR